MASPRPLLLPNRLAETLIEDLGEALAESSLPSGLIRSGDTLSPTDPTRGPRLRTGVKALDRLFSGGLAEGSFAELAGPLSSGLTACAQALAGAASRSAYAAWVDLADAFDPPSANTGGVDLERLLWVRAPTPQIALRASERLLLSRAFSLVVLDFFAVAETRSLDSARTSRRRTPHPPHSAWLRLQRSAAQARCVLLLLSPEPIAGAVPALTLLAHPARPCFEGEPHSVPMRSVSESWLEGAVARFDLVRDRLRPREQSASLPLAAHPEVPPRACRVSIGPRPARRRGATRMS